MSWAPGGDNVGVTSVDRFCRPEPGLFRWIFDTLLGNDEYAHLAAFPSYLDAQRQVGEGFGCRELWCAGRF